MSPPPKGTRSRAPLITPGNSLEEAMNTAKTARGTIKNAGEAKKFLEKEGWTVKGETITLESLAIFLLAHSLLPNTTGEMANIMTATAYLITSNLQDGVAQGVAQSITELLKHSIATMTVEIRENLELHASKLAETAESQAAIAQNMKKTQEDMAESAKQAATQAKTYSQIVATHSPHSLPVPPVPRVTHSQMQIQNREQIKRRQVLIDFEKTEELQLEMMNEETLNRKATEALRTSFLVATDPKPAEVKLKTGTLLRNGGLLLELNSDEAAHWLKSDGVTDGFLERLGSGASIKNRTYQVIVQFVPVSFDPANDEHIRSYEEHNNIGNGSIAKAEWIKPVKDRKTNQKVATLRVFHKDAESANAILKQGAYVFSKRVVPRRPHKEPIRCLRCHKFGHERRICKTDNPYCGKCSRAHETDECSETRKAFKCVNCLGAHPSYDRECPTFWEKRQQMDQRCPENGLAFYPTDEPWTWTTLEHTDTTQAPPPPPNVTPHQPQPHPTLRQTRLTGGNNVPLGSPRNTSPQSHEHHSQ